MRKLASYLLIIVFLTAYGRCVADQMGVLHTSDASCCRIVCDDLRSTCSQCPESTPGDHGEEGGPLKKQENQTPAPCQLCFILGSDSMLIEDGVKLPPPLVRELPASPFTGTLAGATRPDLHSDASLKESPPEPAKPTAILRHCLLRILPRITPVRGPSFA